MPIVLAIIGSRTVDPTDVEITAALEQKFGLLPLQLAAVVDGGADGGDAAGARWAKLHDVEVIREPITAADVARWGKYLAPKARNGRIADRATHCLAFWDCQSNGTTDCMARFLLRGKPVACVRLQPVRKPPRVRR